MLKLVKYPHPALRAAVRPVTTIDKDLQIKAGEMLELMYASEGLGLAAPQVGLDAQVLVMNFAGDAAHKEAEYVAINPVIVETKGNVNDREGCLSFPGLYQNVRRAKGVKVQAYNLKGELFEMTCGDLAARVWQHEIDHLHGVLFIDKMSEVGRRASKRDLDQLAHEFEQAKKKGEFPKGLDPRF